MARVHSLLVLTALLLPSGCFGNFGPDYPATWPAQVTQRPCPDVTGWYQWGISGEAQKLFSDYTDFNISGYTAPTIKYGTAPSAPRAVYWSSASCDQKTNIPVPKEDQKRVSVSRHCFVVFGALTGAGLLGAV